MEPKAPMNEFVTNDLSFTAYLMMRGAQMVKAKKLGKTYKFILDLGTMSIEQLKVAWINSECAEFDSRVRDLKKILFSDKPNDRRYQRCDPTQTST